MSNPIFSTKELAPPSTAPNKIVRLDFGVLDPKEIRQLSAVFVHDSELYESGTVKPKIGGTLDLRLGTTQDRTVCQTCGKEPQECPGHFGSIELVLPVFNIGFYDAIINVLRCICKNCSNILLPRNEIDSRLRSLFNKPPQTVAARVDRMQKLKKECEAVSICPHCGALNGVIRKSKVHTLFINHVIDKNKFVYEQYHAKFSNISSDAKDYLKYVCDDLTPTRVLQLFEAIPTRQVPLLLSGTSVATPADMIIRTIIVPPNCIRPAVIAAGEGTNQDHLTVRLVDSVRFNNDLAKSMEVGRPPNATMEIWNSLQQTVNAFIDSSCKDVSVKTKEKPGMGVIQRLKGKQGRFRTNLSGKRVNFSGRTVISPDPNANIDQVVVPKEVAMTLTFPVRVTRFNKGELRRAILNGPNVYPGANGIIKADTGFHIGLRFGDRERHARTLQMGDIVERHLINDDTVLFNRQPSLHRISIMAFRAKVMEWRTLRFNESACAPFNADFDGDEMNLHLPQTLEAAADARVLMNILNNLFSPRAGEMIVAPTQDFLSGTYLLSRKNVFLDYSHFTNLVGLIFDDQEVVEIPPPAIMYPVQLWTGKQVISLMLAPNKRTGLHFTHRVASKEYSGKDFEMCRRDGYVSFLDNYMVSGVLEKSLIGGGGNSLWAIMARDHSPKFAAICMQRIAKMSTRYLMNRGFSIGITDVTPSDELTEMKTTNIKEVYDQCAEAIDSYTKGTYEAKPGMTVEASLEAQLNGSLSELRDNVGKKCMQLLSPINTPLVMAQSGAKGSAINICQMMACVGQQSVSGKRIVDDYIDRSIPHFPHRARDPAAKGFVANSFYTGLTPFEFFFHTMGGREGLVDAAVKTAQTGYMQRRLMKSLEDLVIAYDQTVRMSDGTIVQFTYGDDGLDPLVLETKQFPVNLVRVSNEIMYKHSLMPLLDPNDVLNAVGAKFAEIRRIQATRGLVQVPPFLIDKLENFIVELCTKYIRMTETSEEHAVRSICPITQEFLDEFIDFCMYRCQKSMAEPGTTVGAVAGQSIGEPATQMTLRSFHFAGVASMNVSLGVPRIEEVMNAVNEIKTPIITVDLLQPKEEFAAREVKALIDRITLDQVAKAIQYIQNPHNCYIKVLLDERIIKECRLKIDAHSVRRSIVEAKIGVGDANSRVANDNEVHISFKDQDPKNFSFVIQSVQLKLPKVVVSGIKGVNMVHVGYTKESGTYKLYVEGTPMLKVLNVPGVDPRKTQANHVQEIERVLGIEAARSVIINEINGVMKNYGMNIDIRHLMLLADLMTIRGRVLGITRHGLSKTSTSSLKLASFETTSEHLFNASFYQVNEVANGVSTSVILGSFVPIGSGMVDVLMTDELLPETALTPSFGGKPFLTPQPKSMYRDSIANGTFSKK